MSSELRWAGYKQQSIGKANDMKKSHVQVVWVSEMRCSKSNVSRWKSKGGCIRVCSVCEASRIWDRHLDKLGSSLG